MILALECSQPAASLCLVEDGGRVLYAASWEAARNHDAHLFPALEQALARKGDAPLGLILVGAGPGSYGGVRVALAAAVGIATVTGARMVAVPSWDSLAAQAGDDACIVSDARRGGWTLRRADGSIEVVTTEQLLAAQAEGAKLFSIEPAAELAERGLAVEAGGLTPRAEGLVQTWLALTDAQRQELAARAPEPIYVRPPHITEAKRKPWECKA